jgi:WD40 repeat protein
MKEFRSGHPSQAPRLAVLAAILVLGFLGDGLTAQPRFSVVYPSWVGAVAYRSDGALLAVGTGDGRTHLLQAKDGRESAVLEGHADAVAAVAFTPDGKRIVTGSFDRTARIWEVQPAKLQRTLDGHRGAVMSVVVSPDSRTLATASIDTSINLWDVSTGELRVTLSGHKSWVNAIVISPDGRFLFTAGSDGTVKVWDFVSSQLLTTLEATTVAGRTPGEVRSLALSPDGRILAAGIRYGWVKLWTGPSWNKSRWFEAHDADVWSVAFHPKTSVLVTGDGDWDRPGAVKLWDPALGTLLAQFRTSGEVLASAYAPDGGRVAIGCWSKQLEVWDTPEIKPRRE